LRKSTFGALAWPMSRINRFHAFDFDPAQRKNRVYQGKIERFTKIMFGSAVGTKAASWTGQIFNNRATGVFDGQDRRRRDEDGERERSQVC
jgi:hypothetical protein